MSEYKNKTREDLQKMLTEKQIALRTFRFGLSGGKVKNVKEGRELKKEIARILTEMPTAVSGK